MALRMIYVAMALALLITTGCHTASRYQPCCPPTPVAAAPCPAPCPPGAVPPPPGVLVPR